MRFAKWFIGFYVFLFSCLALSQDASSETVPNWIDWLADRIPGETIVWVIAFVGLLNAISEGLAKIQDGLEKYAAKTETKTDDKIAAVLEIIVKYLSKFVGFAQTIVNFFTAKVGKKK